MAIVDSILLVNAAANSHKFFCSDYFRSCGKEPIEECGVEVQVPVLAAVRNHDESVVSIARLQQVESTTPLVAMPKRTIVSISFARRSMSRSVPTNALTRCLVKMMSAGSGPSPG